ncbi:MAG: helix-hairpin-helix domain-containing protein [Nitrososphaerota archaeon]
MTSTSRHGTGTVGNVGDELLRIPGVGKSIAHDLRDLGIAQVADLRHADPQALYDALCQRRGAPIDRCVLYVFRCAVYFATEEHHHPELLKWWNWKDRAGNAGTSHVPAHGFPLP